MDEESSTGKAGQIPVRYKIIMVAVVVATLLAVWLVPDDRQAESPPLPELPATKMTDMDFPQSAESGGTVSHGGERARAFVADLRVGGTEPDPGTVFAEAMRLQDEGYTVDAHLLYRFAARHGHGQAALVLGNQANPAFRDADIPDSLKDQPEQAYKWYSMAAAAGIDEAAAQLQDLRKSMEHSASNGDERAQRMLLLWH